MARGGSRKKNKWFGRTIFFCLLAWAVITELRKPEEERTWHGKLAGFVPYELRPPTLDRVRETTGRRTTSTCSSPRCGGSAGR